MKEGKYNINWSDYFKLNENSPSGLDRIKFRGNSIKPRAIGSKNYRANGTPAAWELKFKSKTYSVHRIIWILTYGAIDDSLTVDHLDGNAFNNSINNLMLKTYADNSRNRRKRITSKTGITGVTYIIDKRGHSHYVAHWVELNKLKRTKNFSINKFGEEIARNLAIDYRKQQINRLIIEGANYTKRHCN